MYNCNKSAEQLLQLTSYVAASSRESLLLNRVKLYEMLKIIGIFTFVNLCNCYNILGIFPLASPSHFFLGSALLQGLSKAGHNCTLVSPYLKNFTDLHEIQITGLMERFTGMDFLSMNEYSPVEEISNLYNFGILVTNHTLTEKNVVNLINSDATYDVVILDIFLNEALLGFGRHFNAPVIGVSAFGSSAWTNNLIGNPSPSSFIPHPFSIFTTEMSFLQRIRNTLMAIFEFLSMKYSFYPRQEALFNSAFPNITVPFKEVLRNDVSLVLLNNHFSLNYPRPYLPNAIEVGGLNINREKIALPEDLQILLDEAHGRGVIYFSLGSNIQCKNLPSEKRNALIRVFKKLPHLVLWKWEGEMPDKPDNVVIRKWFPQDAILAHPNVKLFITHGGLLSTTESIYFGKATVGIPVFGDQRLNMIRAEKAGYGLHIPYQDLTEDALFKAVTTVLHSKT